MITTKQERFEIYSKALEILMRMLIDKVEFIQLPHTGVYIEYDDGFCLILPCVQLELFNKLVNSEEVQIAVRI